MSNWEPTEKKLYVCLTLEELEANNHKHTTNVFEHVPLEEVGSVEEGKKRLLELIPAVPEK